MSESYTPHLFSIDPYVTLNAVQKSENCSEGNYAELLMAAEASKRNLYVFQPWGHAQKADLVLWNPPSRPVTIQVKKATIQKSGSWKFMIGSGRPSCAVDPTNRGLRYKKYATGDFDILCAFIKELSCFAFYRLNEISGLSSMHWHSSKSRRNNWSIFDHDNIKLLDTTNQ